MSGNKVERKYYEFASKVSKLTDDLQLVFILYHHTIVNANGGRSCYSIYDFNLEDSLVDITLYVLFTGVFVMISTL
ncbi:MAG: hypothetical protein IPL97_01210 [Niastella sp.]|nr:hypothetical protein [Niastella sp.]